MGKLSGRIGKTTGRIGKMTGRIDENTGRIDVFSERMAVLFGRMDLNTVGLIVFRKKVWNSWECTLNCVRVILKR